MGGIISSALFNLLIISSLAKSDQGGLLVGSYALAMAIIGPMRLFLEASLRGYLASEKQPDIIFPIYKKTRLLTTIVLIISLSFVFLCLERNHSLLLTMFLILGIRATETVADICLGLFLRNSQNKIYVNSMLFRYVPAIVIITSASYIFKEPLIGMFLVLIWSSLILWFYDFVKTRNTKFESNNQITIKDAYKFWMQFSVVGVSSLISGFAHNFPRFSIEFFSGRSALGIFTVILTIGQVVEVINQSLVQPSISRFAKKYHESTNQLKDLYSFLYSGFKFVALIGVVVGGVYSMIGYFLIEQFFGVAYLDWYHAGYIIIVAKCIDGCKAYLKQSLYITKAVGIQFWVSIPEGLSSVVLAAICVKFFGIWGGCWSILAISIVSTLLYMFISYKHFKKVFVSKL